MKLPQTNPNRKSRGTTRFLILEWMAILEPIANLGGLESVVTMTHTIAKCGKGRIEQLADFLKKNMLPAWQCACLCESGPG
jgi:hypothetical protein